MLVVLSVVQRLKKLIWIKHGEWSTPVVSSNHGYSRYKIGVRNHHVSVDQEPMYLDIISAANELHNFSIVGRATLLPEKEIPEDEEPEEEEEEEDNKPKEEPEKELLEPVNKDKSIPRAIFVLLYNMLN